MIDAKSAIRAAIAYLQGFSEYIPAYDIRLEEIEHDQSGQWLITLSATDSPAFGQRNYRVFRVDSSSGEVLSMKVRTLQPVE